MYLHLGEGHMISAADIVMVGNLNTTSSNITKEFLNISREKGFIVDYTSGNPRSFVLTEEKVYLSIISSTTLEKRMNKFIRNGGI